MLDGALMPPSISEYMRSVFGPLVKVCGRPTLLERLKTKRIGKDREAEQFERLKQLSLDGLGPVQLQMGGFYSRFRGGGNVYCVISVDHLNSEDEDRLVDFFNRNGCINVEYEECFLLFFCHHMGGHYTVSRGQSEDQVADFVTACEEDVYSGHEIMDVSSLYQKVMVFEVAPDSAFYSSSDWYVVALLTTELRAYRSPMLGDDIVHKAAGLLSLKNINPENIFLSLSAIHWKHSFLEIYRCLEAVYFLPWMVELKEQSGSAMHSMELAKVVKGIFNWREKENKSIEKIFEMAPDDMVLAPDIRQTLAFKDVESGNKALIGRRVYKIRNQSVHQADYEEITPTKLTEPCWARLVNLVFDVVQFTYSRYEIDIPFDFVTQGEVTQFEPQYPPPADAYTASTSEASYAQ